MKKIVITTGIIAVAGGLVTALTMSSCDHCENEDRDAPTIIAQFVGEGPDGNAKAMVPDRVWYEWTDEDGTVLNKEAKCMDDKCEEWGIGNGKTGTYRFHASVCGHEYEEEVVIHLDDEGCREDSHLVDVSVDAAACQDDGPEAAPEDLDVKAKLPQLQFIPDAEYQANHPKQCTLEARISVIASTWAEVDGKMQPIKPNKVFYTWDGEPNGRELEGMCLDSECYMFGAGFETAGEFTVGAEVCGKEVRTTATVEKTPDGCHVETQRARLIADVRDCEGRPDYTLIEGLETPLTPNGDALTTCLPNTVPSAIVIPVDFDKDVYISHPTEELVYIHDDERFKAHCGLEADNGKCAYWVTGWGKTGRFQARTETCETETVVDYSIELADDGCVPKTQYIYVEVDTQGCIKATGRQTSPRLEVPAGADDVAR